MTSLDLAKAAAQVAENKKATRIVLQDLRGQSDLCDFQLVCSASNDKQTQAICQGLEDHARTQYNVKAYAVEGKETGSWILLDYGSFIAHIFNDEVRDYYAIDQLWPRAKAVVY